MRLFSPSKINLFFRVLQKRNDGYHEIVSLFQAIDFFDFLEFKFSDEDRLTCTDSTLACDSTNLIYQAREIFRSQFPLPPVHIHLIKQIPIQSGLGGGSGNAATTLWGLNRLLKGIASEEQLRDMGAQLGSDVAFFFSSGTAYCTGRGEKIDSVMPPDQDVFSFSGWIAKPVFGLSTPLVYKNTFVDGLPCRDPLLALRSFSTDSPLYFNDLEISSFQLEPRLIAIKEQLLQQFKTVVMTGSGTAFFCLHPFKEVQPIKKLVLHPFSSLRRDPAGWYCASVACSATLEGYTQVKK
jgi:4-diphosphocytidyl-2-C-methyl-D-erythritol kinase